MPSSRATASASATSSGPCGGGRAAHTALPRRFIPIQCLQALQKLDNGLVSVRGRCHRAKTVSAPRHLRTLLFIPSVTTLNRFCAHEQQSLSERERNDVSANLSVGALAQWQLGKDCRGTNKVN